MTLAREVRSRGGQASFVIRKQSLASFPRHDEENPNVFPIDTDMLDFAPLDESDQRATLGVAKSQRADWLVVDHYGAASAYLAAVAKQGLPVAVIDDLGDRDLTSADLIINPTPGSDQWNFRIGPTAVRCCGGRI